MGSRGFRNSESIGKLVMDEPGQTLADVNENTMAFAIDLPNINLAHDLVRDANGNLVKPTD